MAKDKIAGLDAEDVERAGLSEEEREALEDETDDEATLKEVAGEGEADAGDDGKDRGAKAEGEADEEDEEDDDRPEAKGEAGDDEADEEEEAEADEEEEDEADEEEEDETDSETAKGKDGDGGEEGAAAADEDAGDDGDDDLPPPIPVYKAPAVEKYDEQMKALEDADAAAYTKFKAGDMELDALLAEQKQNAAKRAELREAKLKADISSEQSEQARVAAWLYEVETFMRGVKRTDGVDYRGNNLLNAAFDTAVKALAAVKENEDKPGRWFLREAHKQVMAAMGRAPAAKGKAGTDADAEAAKQAAVKGRKPDLKVVPKTLSGKPAAGDDDAGGDPEFAHLDRLDGMDLEMAIAAMTPAQQERWARSR